MKFNKVVYLVAIMLILTVLAAVVHLTNREEVPEHALQIKVGEENILIDIDKLDYIQVSGIRVNGKGEEIPVEGDGILLKDILARENIADYSKVTVVADDSYSAEVNADEIAEDGKVYLMPEEGSMRLQVFGDENSKRNVAGVVQIIVE